MARRGGIKGKISGETVAVEGYQELMRCLKKMDDVSRKAMRANLRNVARFVGREAQARAEARGLRITGELIRKIKPSVTARSVAIRATASKQSRRYPGGFNYPRRHEYENGGARAFMQPALEAKQNQVKDEFLEIFDQLQREWTRDG